MIDTDKYKGHSEGGWGVIYPDWLDRMCVSTGEALYRPHCSTQEIEARVANMKLMADAPLLLEEVKELQKFKRAFDRLYKMADADPDWKELMDDIWEMIE
tara:strand:- start:40 stop:339 length:300 start_codon:yes stop_codon:yes gene_type:complete